MINQNLSKSILDICRRTLENILGCSKTLMWYLDGKIQQALEIRHTLTQIILESWPISIVSNQYKYLNKNYYGVDLIKRILFILIFNQIVTVDEQKIGISGIYWKLLLGIHACTDWLYNQLVNKDSYPMIKYLGEIKTWQARVLISTLGPSVGLLPITFKITSILYSQYDYKSRNILKSIPGIGKSWFQYIISLSGLALIILTSARGPAKNSRAMIYNKGNTSYVKNFEYYDNKSNNEIIKSARNEDGDKNKHGWVTGAKDKYSFNNTSFSDLMWTELLRQKVYAVAHLADSQYTLPEIMRFEQLYRMLCNKDMVGENKAYIFVGDPYLTHLNSSAKINHDRRVTHKRISFIDLFRMTIDDFRYRENLAVFDVLANWENYTPDIYSGPGTGYMPSSLILFDQLLMDADLNHKLIESMYGNALISFVGEKISRNLNLSSLYNEYNEHVNLKLDKEIMALIEPDSKAVLYQNPEGDTLLKLNIKLSNGSELIIRHTYQTYLLLIIHMAWREMRYYAQQYSNDQDQYMHYDSLCREFINSGITLVGNYNDLDTQEKFLKALEDISTNMNMSLYKRSNDSAGWEITKHNSYVMGRMHWEVSTGSDKPVYRFMKKQSWFVKMYDYEKTDAVTQSIQTSIFGNARSVGLSMVGNAPAYDTNQEGVNKMGERKVDEVESDPHWKLFSHKRPKDWSWTKFFTTKIKNSLSYMTLTYIHNQSLHSHCSSISYDYISKITHYADAIVKNPRTMWGLPAYHVQEIFSGSLNAFAGTQVLNLKEQHPSYDNLGVTQEEILQQAKIIREFILQPVYIIRRLCHFRDLYPELNKQHPKLKESIQIAARQLLECQIEFINQDNYLIYKDLLQDAFLHSKEDKGQNAGWDICHRLMNDFLTASKKNIREDLVEELRSVYEMANKKNNGLIIPSQCDHLIAYLQKETAAYEIQNLKDDLRNAIAWPQTIQARNTLENFTAIDLNYILQSNDPKVIAASDFLISFCRGGSRKSTKKNVSYNLNIDLRDILNLHVGGGYLNILGSNSENIPVVSEIYGMNAAMKTIESLPDFVPLQQDDDNNDVNAENPMTKFAEECKIARDTKGLIILNDGKGVNIKPMNNLRLFPFSNQQDSKIFNSWIEKVEEYDTEYEFGVYTPLGTVEDSLNAIKSYIAGNAHLKKRELSVDKEQMTVKCGKITYFYGDSRDRPEKGLPPIDQYLIL